MNNYRVGENPQNVDVAPAVNRTPPKTIAKTALVVGGLLLLLAGTALYFTHVNAIATYAVLGAGGAALLMNIVFRITGWKHTMDLGRADTHQITPEQAAEIIKNNPYVIKLVVNFRSQANTTNEQWGQNIIGEHLETYFRLDRGASSGFQYVFYRKASSYFSLRG